MMARGAGARPGGRGFGGPGMFGMALPPQKTKDMGKTLRQLLARLRPERVRPRNDLRRRCRLPQRPPGQHRARRN